MVSYEHAMRNGHFAVVSDGIATLTGRAPKSFRAFVDERTVWLKKIASE